MEWKDAGEGAISPAELERWRGSVDAKIAQLQATVVSSHSKMEAYVVELRAEVVALRRTLWISAFLGGSISGVLVSIIAYGWLAVR